MERVWKVRGESIISNKEGNYFILLIYQFIQNSLKFIIPNVIRGIFFIINIKAIEINGNSKF